MAMTKLQILERDFGEMTYQRNNWRAEAERLEAELARLTAERTVLQEQNRELRTAVRLTQKRLIELQHDADDFGVTAIGTKAYALRQYLTKYVSEPGIDLV